MEDELKQYHEEVKRIQREADSLDSQIEESQVKEHEVMVVTALIEEKSRLGEEKT